MVLDDLSRKRFRSAILHIGTEKTGSTAVQYMLGERRAELAALGVYYPLSLGEMGHIGLAVYAADETTQDMKPVLAEYFGVEQLDETMIRDRLAAELAAVPETVHTVIFSSEHCHSRLVYPSHVERLQALLAPYFETISVLVYLRRQDEMASSSYSTRLRAGEWNVDLLPKFPPPALKVEEGEEYNPSQYFNFKPMLDFYARFFGKANVVPRIYERAALAGGDVLTDFLAFCGLPPALAENIENMEIANRALVAQGQDFLEAMNAFYGRAGRQDEGCARKIREACITIIEGQFTGRPHLPTRAQALAFYGQYAQTNELVRRDWFPGRERLFSEDFRNYPQGADNAGKADGEAVLRVAFAVIESLAKDREWLLNQLSSEAQPPPCVPEHVTQDNVAEENVTPDMVMEENVTREIEMEDIVKQDMAEPPLPARMKAWLAAKRPKWQ